MDLNELLHAHQLASMRADESDPAAVCQNQFDLISDYARRIRLLRTQGGIPEPDPPFVHGEIFTSEPAP